MKEKSTSKRKNITYYLILAACLVAVAAITVGVVFAVRANTAPVDSIIDNTDTPDNPDNPDTPDNPDDDDDDETKTNTATDFIMPVTNVNLSQSHVFWYDKTLDRYCMHQGIDFSADVGEEVFSVIDGTVIEISTRDVLYGGSVTVSHTNGIKTRYRFIDVNEDLEVGDRLSRGDVIGTVASPVGVESESGSHLHFEVFANDVMVDPDDYLNLTEK